MKHSILFIGVALMLLPKGRAQNAEATFIHEIQGTAVPWTHTDFKNDPADFSFAIVADRTNGHRKGVFASAVEKLNDLQPEFVLSVGDLIEGYTTDTMELQRQWKEFNDLLAPLQMPFFRVPGNHDLSNEMQLALWEEQFGRDYYHFTYKNVLFMVMNSNDGDGKPFREEQLAYAEKTIQEHPDVRWTFVLMHHPVWKKRAENGFGRIEKALEKRDYTVIAGHTHRYLASVYNDQNYYILATTGGSTRMRGKEFGETDHISWITMTDDGPSLVNLELDGILKDDFSNEYTYQLARTLGQDANLNPLVLLSDKKAGREGKIYLDHQNNADLELTLKTRFFQHPSLLATGAPGELKLSPGARKQVALQVKHYGNGQIRGSDTLVLQNSWSYVSEREGLPHLERTVKIPMERTVPEIIEKEVPVFLSTMDVGINDDFLGSKVVYTLDGSDPNPDSKVYTGAFRINETTTVKAMVLSEDKSASSLVETVTFEKLEFLRPSKVHERDLQKGLRYTYYEESLKILPDFSKLKPIKSGVLESFDLDVIKERDNEFAVLIEGYLEVEQEDLYTFYLTSDDGARLFLGDRLIVDNDGSHSARTRSGHAALEVGKHAFKIEYFEDFDGELIQLEYAGEGGDRKEVPFSQFFTAATKISRDGE